MAPHTDECQVIEKDDGTLLINMRNYWGRQGGRPDRGSMRALATSQDGGATWSELSFDQTLIEPICQASLIRHAGHGAADESPSRLLFSNPASPTDRVDLTVRLSYDSGKTWPVSRLLNAGRSAYSNLAILPDGTIGCLYERGKSIPYETITFARFTMDWLVGGG